MCDQQSLRPACAYAQPDQSLCLSLEYSMIVKLLTERHLEFLSITGGCRGPSESTLVKMSNCWKSRALAQIYKLWSLSVYSVSNKQISKLRHCIHSCGKCHLFSMFIQPLPTLARHISSCARSTLM